MPLLHIIIHVSFPAQLLSTYLHLSHRCRYLLAVSNECECGFRPTLVAYVSGKSLTSVLACVWFSTNTGHISSNAQQASLIPKCYVCQPTFPASCLLCSPARATITCHFHTRRPSPPPLDRTSQNTGRHPTVTQRRRRRRGGEGRGGGGRDHCAAVLRRCARPRRVSSVALNKELSRVGQAGRGRILWLSRPCE